METCRYTGDTDQVGRPATGKTPLRNIRATDDVWKPALARAHAEGTDLTKVLVAFLKEYGAGWSAEEQENAAGTEQ